ncbi:MAG TPA: Ig-like domain-containing protein [Archangium sp.]|uniref:adventurous gliding motility protein AgmC n=1 Tax=Archangium sp. TaxID=1872627 RepID=UPI002E360697|nr:Ig-like domain-containing protein [Archangium sp.]HEX5745918.1 Ig-like domain-containing protein [Archangium sp.]
MRYVYTRALLFLVLLASGVAVAEPDTFGLGTHRDGALNARNPSIVNAYAHVVTNPLAPGDMEILISGVREGNETGRNTADTAFQTGDLVMVLQTTGAVPPIPTGLTTAVDLEAYNVGRWEFARLASASTSKLTLTAPLMHGYPVTATQVIRVPEYSTVTVGNSKEITAETWDGRSGGVIAFLADGAVTVTGTGTNAGIINASELGFRGGVYKNGSAASTSCTTNSGSSPDYAQKGEGVDSTRYAASGDLGANEGAGRGNFANGGGGGNCPVSGGGGGGNAALGGNGGPSTTGGMGGVPLLYSLLDRLTFGGGGGSGHGTRLSFGQSNGGRGGGIIFIRAASLTLESANSIRVSGKAGTAGGNRLVLTDPADGGGGGGAGGTILVRLTGTLNCNNQTIITARGGAGGDVDSGASPTPSAGGGGGGGRVLYQMGTTEMCSSPIATVSGGLPGSGTTVGATSGGTGSVSSLPGPFPTLLAPTLDPVAPADGGYTNLRRPTLTGGRDTAYAGRQVVIYQGSVEVGRTVADASGRFSFKMPQDLFDGVYQVSAAFAYQGVQSPKSTVQTFTVDGTPPANPLVDLLASREAVPNMLIGLPDLEAVTSKLYISGRSEPGSTVTVQQNGPSGTFPPASATTDALGKWRVGIVQPSNVETATYTLTVSAEDRAHNTSPPSITLTFRLDTKLPATPVFQTVGGVTAGGTVPANSLRPVLEGTADNGNKVVVTLSRTGTGAESQTLETTSSSGGWKVVPSVPLTDGASYNVDVTAFDLAGNEQAGMRKSFSVDVSPPALVISRVGASSRSPASGMLIGTPDLSSSSLSLSGTAEALSSITVRQIGPGSPADQVTSADGSGNWSVNLAQPANTDTTYYSLEVKAKDTANNTTTATLDFRLDTRIPTAPFVTFVGGVAPDASCAASGVFVTTRQPLIQGTGEARGTVNVTLVSSSTVPSTVVNGSGAWSVSPTGTPLTDGAYTLTATLTDEAGNPSEPATYCFNVDATRPDKPTAIAVVTTSASGTVTTPAVSGMRIGRALLTEVRDVPVSGEPVPNGKLSITGSANDTTGPVAKVQLKLIPLNPALAVMESLVTVTSGTWTKDWPGLASGSYALEARAVDAANNIGDPQTIFFELDLIRPTATVTGRPTEGTITASKEFAFGFDTSERVQAYECTINNSLVPCTNPFLSSVAISGTYQLKVWVTDMAGNKSLDPATRNWTVDTDQPVVFILNRSSIPTGGSSTQQTDITFQLRANKEGLDIYCQKDLDSAEWAKPCECTRWEPASDGKLPQVCIKTYTDLSEAPHVFVVKAVSPTTNAETSEAERQRNEWVVDKTNPDTFITEKPGDWVAVNYATVKFATPTESQTPDFQCELTKPDSTIVVSKCSGSSSHLMSGLADGSYTLRIKAIDAAGNEETDPAVVSWTVDTQGPAAPVLNVPSAGRRYKDLLLTGTAAGEPFSVVSAYVDDPEGTGTPIGTATVTASGTWQLTVAAERKPEDGLHSVTLKATDRAGNPGTLSVPVSFFMDNQPPSVQISGPDKNTASRTAAFQFITNEEGVTFQCKLDLQDPVECGTNVSYADLEEGPHTLNVYAVDEAGNRREVGYSWSVYLGRDIRAEGGGLGCSTTSAQSPALWLLGLFGLLLDKASRRRGKTADRQ